MLDVLPSVRDTRLSIKNAEILEGEGNRSQILFFYGKAERVYWLS